MRVLVIEDDARSADYLARALREAGHIADQAADGATGLALVREGIYDALLVDRQLPVLDGMALVRRLRAEGFRLPVLMLSGMGGVQHRVDGLQAGCDDYLAKPYAMVELLARLDGMLARAASRPARQGLRVADLTLDTATRVATRAGRRIALSGVEYLLLERLMRQPGHTISRAMLLESAWGYDFEPPDHLIDRHMHRLRKKVDEGHAPLIESVRGVGYRMAGTGPEAGSEPAN